MKYLLIGGAGFIGSALVARMLEAETDSYLVVFDLFRWGVSEGNLGNETDRLKIICDDACNIGEYIDILSDVDVLIYLAADTGTSSSVAYFSQHIKYNFSPLLSTLELTRKLPVLKRFIFLSSRAVYGEGAYKKYDESLVFPGLRNQMMLSEGRWEFSALSPVPTNETHPKNPVSPYGLSKAISEETIEHFMKLYNPEFKMVIVRPQNVYGEGQNLSNSYAGVLGKFYRLLKQNLEVPVYEDGKMLRDWVHISDVVSCLYSLASIAVFDKNYTLLNLGSGNSFAMIDVVRLMKDLMGSNSNIKVTSEARLGDIRHAMCDCSEIKKILGKAEFLSLDKGLNRFIEFNDHHVLGSEHLLGGTMDLEREMSEKNQILVNSKK